MSRFERVESLSIRSAPRIVSPACFDAHVANVHPVRAGTCSFFDCLGQPVIALGDAQISNDRVCDGHNPIYFIH